MSAYQVESRTPILHPSALLPALLALAAVASIATKLRASGLPLGIGEFLLVSWLAASGIFRSSATGFSYRPSAALNWGGPFLLALAGTLSIGAIAANATGVTSAYSTVHEAVAWVFIGVLVGWFLLEAYMADEVLRFLRWFAGLGAASLTMLLAIAIGLRFTSGNQFMWYGGFRLSGLSENPNQLAILCSPLPFLCIHFAQETRGFQRCAWIAGTVGCIATGIATFSDALLLAWGTCAGGLCMYKWVAWIFGKNRNLRTVLVATLALPALFGMAMTIFGGAVIDKLEAFAEERAGEGGQASTRLVLWQRGLEATLESPLVGWGPGAHSGYAGPFEGSEAHSALIDLAAQAGLPVALALVFLVAWSVVTATARNAPYLALAVVSGFVFSLFHNTLRQPVYWLTIIAVMAACTRETSASRTLHTERQ